ncbi:hypothetical protein A3860_04375 [Niastella vici]|uniref:Uncharacterized protein n=1 Tax=Niastella vici TaxID=1703345 RepID=A0A1V9FRL2_9BACT|nr:DUF6223 family protein [Niastella vici]OQP60968.1 hypothetical protein A3860_04375 [Niastella vici]
MNIQSLLQASLFVQVFTIWRLASIILGMVGFISLVIGRQALARSTGPIGSRRPKAMAALLVGLTGVALSVLHLALSTGGFGTGSGKLGAIVALVLGLAGAVLGMIALVRSRRIAGNNSDIIPLK